MGITREAHVKHMESTLEAHIPDFKQFKRIRVHDDGKHMESP
jgi:hypothetical protein